MQLISFVFINVHLSANSWDELLCLVKYLTRCGNAPALPQRAAMFFAQFFCNVFLEM